MFVENLSEWVVDKPTEIFELLKRGMALRTTAPTKINDLSSRSHAVFIICLENVVSMNIEGKQVSTVRRAKLNLIGRNIRYRENEFKKYKLFDHI